MTNKLEEIQENQAPIITVTDDGPGFSEINKQNLFQPFMRLSAKPTGGETPTGLDLSIVKLLVSAHNGKIPVENRGKIKPPIYR